MPVNFTYPLDASISALSLLVYHFSKPQYGADIAQTMTFLCVILQEMVYAINCRNLKEPIVKQGIFSNKAMNIGMLVLILMQILVFSTPIGSLFKITPLNFTQVLIVVIVNIVAFLFIELSKPIIKKLFKY